jgi:hypothetical protein
MMIRKIRLAVWIGAASLLLASAAIASDLGKRDVLRLSDAVLDNGEWKVAVHVISDEELAGLDIPIRFGQPGDDIELVRVEFANRVSDWDFTHAQIDNQAKTAVLGLISELVNVRPHGDMMISAESGTKVAELVLKVGNVDNVHLETFTTENPGHELTFLYNRYENGVPAVEEFTPEFEANVNFKQSALPSTFELSQNFPNPFNPQTSFTLSLPEKSDYSVRVFNVAGQTVKTFEGHLGAGVHTITWDGKNQNGAQVASGMYFYRAEAGSHQQTHKMMMLK